MEERVAKERGKGQERARGDERGRASGTRAPETPADSAGEGLSGGGSVRMDVDMDDEWVSEGDEGYLEASDDDGLNSDEDMKVVKLKQKIRNKEAYFNDQTKGFLFCPACGTRKMNGREYFYSEILQHAQDSAEMGRKGKVQ